MDGETGIHGRAAALNAGRLIRDRRNARGLDQEALGALLGKSQAQIESWESGADLPTEPSDRYALDQALDLDVESSATLTQHILEWAVDRADNATRAATRTMQAINVAPEGIFVVHGHDEALKNEVASFLAEATPDKIVILSEEPNRGRTIIEKFERHAAGAKFAVVLMTPDDEMADSRRRARPNVILELGYFIGRLGRDKVCVIRRGPIDDPSDLAGVMYTPVEASGDWKSELARELRAAGIEVSTDP